MRSLFLAAIAAAALPAANAAPVPQAQVQAARWGYSFDGRWNGGWRAPGGWAAYRRPDRGFFVPEYWRARGFEIADFARYALQAPPPGYRWHRYYDDAVLIDTDGRVTQSVAGIDWRAGEVAFAGGYRPEYYDAGGRFVGAGSMQVATVPKPVVTFAPRAARVQPVVRTAPQVAVAVQPPVVRLASEPSFTPPAEVVQPLPDRAVQVVLRERERPAAPLDQSPRGALYALAETAPPPALPYAGDRVSYAGRQYDSSGAGALRTVQQGGNMIHHYPDGTTVTVTPGYASGGYWYPPVTTTTIRIER